jgi:L-xylulokinase
MQTLPSRQLRRSRVRQMARGLRRDAHRLMPESLESRALLSATMPGLTGDDATGIVSPAAEVSTAAVPRAVLEGIAFGHCWHMRRLLLHRPAPAAVRLTGGIGRLESWAQLFADALGLPVEVPAGRELGALGAAILAASAAGHGPLPAAAAWMTRIDRVYEPAASRSRLLQARFARFTQALESLAPWWS